MIRACNKNLHSIDTGLAKIVTTLENDCRKYLIRGPEVGVKDVKTSIKTEVIRDELIAQDVFIWLQGVTELLLRAIRTTTTNDNLRNNFIKISKRNIGFLDDMIPYLRNKGWLNPPLEYLNK